MTASERRNILEVRTIAAYSVYAAAANKETPWEHLPENEREGWRHAIGYLDEEPECTCGQTLLCVDCDEQQVYICPKCHAPLTCICGWIPASAKAKEQR